MSNDVAYKMINDVITHTECVVAVYVDDEIDYVGRDIDKIWDAATACDEVEIGLLREVEVAEHIYDCLLYTSPSPRDRTRSRMPSSA